MAEISKCPECGSAEDWISEDGEGRWAHCEFCGFTKYDEWTLAIQAEVKREQAECKRVLGFVPDYEEARRRGLAK
jgi:hypothetical protein